MTPTIIRARVKLIYWLAFVTIFFVVGYIMFASFTTQRLPSHGQGRIYAGIAVFSIFAGLGLYSFRKVPLALHFDGDNLKTRGLFGASSMRISQIVRVERVDTIPDTSNQTTNFLLGRKGGALNVELLKLTDTSNRWLCIQLGGFPDEPRRAVAHAIQRTLSKQQVTLDKQSLALLHYWAR